jgi:Transglutaminase-like superfamily
MRNFTNNSQIYGGRMIAEMSRTTNESPIAFANHGIMVAKPNEPSLQRLTNGLLKETEDNREKKIQRLVDFVSNEIEYSYTEAVGGDETLKRADEVLMTRAADCSNKTILLASLLEQIGEEYILLYCPQHITVAVPQGNFPNENKLDFTWNGKPWMIAETTLPDFQIGKTRVQNFNKLTKIQYVQNPKETNVIFDANSYALLKFY